MWSACDIIIKSWRGGAWWCWTGCVVVLHCRLSYRRWSALPCRVPVAYDARALGCGLLPCVLCRRWFSSLTIGGASLQALPCCKHKKARIARAFWLYLFIYPNQSKRRINANGDPYRMRGGCSAGRQYVSGGINCGYVHAII